jgi:hypothetical protein
MKNPTIKEIEKLLPNEMFDSKCWKQDNVIEKIECLLAWLKSAKNEVNELYAIIEELKGN